MILNSPYISGSLTVTGNANILGALTVTGSLSGTAATASFALTLGGTGSVGFVTTGAFAATSGSASSRLTQIEQVYATTGSNSFRATQSITGSLTVTGQIIAQTINVQQVTSSIVYSSGSNVFGCDINSRQTFTGSAFFTGSSHVIYGKVSVGTGSSFSESTFDVVGTNVFRENAESAHSWFPYTNGSVYISSRTGSAIYFREYHDTYNRVSMIITNGNLGVGSAVSPTHTLEVSGSMRYYNCGDNAEFKISRTVATKGAGIGLYTGTTQNWLIGTAWGETSCNFIIYNGSTGKTPIRANYSNDYVGIGNITPTTQLDVFNNGVGGTCCGTLVTLRGGNSASDFCSKQIVLAYYDGSNQYGHSIRSRHHSGDYLNAIDFFVWKQGTDTPSTPGSQLVMTLIQGGSGCTGGTGRVGIGTCSPQAKLDIATGASRNIYMGASSNNSNYNVISLTDSLADSGFVGLAAGATGDNNLYITAQNCLVFRPSGTTQRMILNSSGYLALPYQPAFQVYRAGSNQSLVNGADYKIDFNCTRYDIASNTSNNGRFIAPISGRYAFASTVRFDGASTDTQYIRLYFTINGCSGSPVPYTYGHAIAGPGSYSTSYHSMSIAAILNLTANDCIEVYGGLNGGNIGVQFESQFSGHLVG